MQNLQQLTINETGIREHWGLHCHLVETMTRIGTISDVQRKEIIKLIKRHVKEQKNCRIGWAAKEIVGNEVQFHILDKIAAEIIENIRYTRDSANPNFEYDWNIRINPLFRTLIFNSILTIISVLAAISSAYFAFKYK